MIVVVVVDVVVAVVADIIAIISMSVLLVAGSRNSSAISSKNIIWTFPLVLVAVVVAVAIAVVVFLAVIIGGSSRFSPPPIYIGSGSGLGLLPLLPLIQPIVQTGKRPLGRFQCMLSHGRRETFVERAVE